MSEQANIPRIGLPPPEKEPVVMPRIADAHLARMSAEELRAHLTAITVQVEQAMEYQEMLVDRIVIRRDMEGQQGA